MTLSKRPSLALRWLVLLPALGAGRADATGDPALRCQHAIERAGLHYARALLRSASDCAAQGSGPIASCYDARLGEPALAGLRARWEARAAAACAATSLGSDLGYFPTCRGAPAACASLDGGVGCLACRLEQHVRTVVVALYANAPEGSACHAALARPGVRALGRLLRQLGRCLGESDAVSIAVCFGDGGIGERLDATVAGWRSEAIAACGATDPFTTLGYPTLCSGVAPEPINSCSRSAPPCTLPETTRLDGNGADDDLLDCLGCQVEEAALAVTRELFGANLCCTPQTCGVVRTRASCRRMHGTPVYFEDRPFTILTDSPPYFAHGMDIAADGTLYVAGNSVVRVPDPSGTSAAGDVLWNPEVFPTGAALDGEGNLYVASRCANKIYEVTPFGEATVVAGTGVAGHSGDEGPATAAEIVGVNRVAPDAAGNVYFTESGFVGYSCGTYVPRAENVRRIDTAGVIHTVTGVAQLFTPFTLRFVSDGGLLVSEYTPNRVQRIDPGGSLTQVAGRYRIAPGGFAGDGGPALRARFHRIEGLRPGAGGELYIGDVENHRVRLIDPLGSVITIAGTGELGSELDFAPGPVSPLGFSAELAVHPDGRVFVSNTCTDDYQRFLRVLVRVPF